MTLWFFSLITSFALIVFSNKNKLPLGKGDFAFLVILALCVALYRPRWIFFLFVSAIALENIILVGGFLPLQLRPYQFLGAVLIAAVAILYFFKKLNFEILKPSWIDWLLFSLVPLGFLTLINSPNKSATLKQNLVLISFVALYYLVRNFIRTKDDLIKTAFFFVGSFLVVVIYGFYQVFADKFLAYRQAGGWQSFEIMFGRPNSTFAEPDWLGIFLCFALAVLLALIFYFLRTKKKFFVLKKYIITFLDILIFFSAVLIILTLSRSAWIGACAIIFFYFIALVPTYKLTIVKMYAENWSRFFREMAIILIIIVTSIATVRFGKLSKFDIFDRARSAATNEQKITVACEGDKNIPDIVVNINELLKYNCRHINLEEINYYKSQGEIVTEIYRKDPNVLTRGQIYQKSWKIIKTHPVLGVGFGTITQALGTDERGMGLNESNIFLQIWAGSGILGLLAFIAVLGYLFIYSFRRISPICLLNKIIGRPVMKDDFEKTVNVFAILGIAALIIPNLFNAGLLMGSFWLGLAVTASIREIKNQIYSYIPAKGLPAGRQASVND